MQETTLPAIKKLPEKNNNSHIIKLLHHKMCDKCQNPIMLGQAERGSVRLGQIREDFPAQFISTVLLLIVSAQTGLLGCSIGPQ